MKQLQILQLEKRMALLKEARKLPDPVNGWVKGVRTTLGITLRQLADKLSITKQSVQELERRESMGNVTISTLKQVANALDMELVYGLVPKDGSIDQLVERKAFELAREIVMRTHVTMKLEDQATSEEQLKHAIHERAKQLKERMPKMLWD